MTRMPPGRREVYPSRRATGERRGPSFGPRLNVSVPISIGLPLLVVGLALLLAAYSSGRIVFLVAGAAALAVGLTAFASGKRL
jgi:hypothetical protein